MDISSVSVLAHGTEPVEDGAVSEPLTAARFGLLGPLRVADAEGQILAVPAAKQRVVLAALLLSANATVSIEKLAGALWGASPRAT